MVREVQLPKLCWADDVTFVPSPPQPCLPGARLIRIATLHDEFESTSE
jgi:hypothetical protein